MRKEDFEACWSDEDETYHLTGDQVVTLQDIREGEALDNVRDMIVLLHKEGVLPIEAANTVLSELDMGIIEEEA